MTNLSYLAQSVEATRLRKLESLEDFYCQASRDEIRESEVGTAISDWAPAMSITWAGSDRFVVAITEPDGKTFADAYHLRPGRSIRELQQLTPLCLIVRANLPSPLDGVSAAEQWVLGEIAITFMPL